ncbi:MAG: leucine-rich repeat protein [Aristaeellaceae bacterium]
MDGFQIEDSVLVKYEGEAEHVTIPTGVTGIGSYAFSYCKTLKSVSIPEGVTSIGDYAFAMCTALEQCRLPASVTALGDNVWMGCSSLTGVDIDAANPVYRAQAGMVWHTGAQKLIFCSPCQAEVTVPDGIREIGKDAFTPGQELYFGGHSLLRKVVLPDSLERIGENAFRYCSQLEEIRLPKALKTLGANALEGCSRLTAVELPDGLTRINKEVFLACSSLQSVKLPTKLKKIGKHAFRGCSSLKELDFPEGLTDIEHLAFEGCHSLTRIVLPRSARGIGKMVFWDCPAVRYIRIQNPDMDLTGKAFQDCKALERMDIPSELAKELNRLLPEHFVAIGVPSIEGVSAKYRPMAAAAFAEDERDTTDANGQAYVQYIKANAAKLVEVAVSHPMLLRLMLREKLIAAKHLDAVTAAVQHTGDTELMAAILEYGHSGVSDKAKAKARAQQEARDERVTSFLFDADALEILSGKTFAVAGKLRTFASHEELRACLTTAGATLTETLTAEVSYLLTNTPNANTAKHQKADALGIRKITETEFNEMIGRQSP